jgi:asparagine N-glycosylation enzyme membrane subunit Stt3
MIVAYRIIPGFAAWYQQNPFASPELIDFLLGFAPLLILGSAGLYLYVARRRASAPSRDLPFLIAWLIVGPIMAYLPIAIGRRMIAGWQIPLCIFAAYALLRLIDSKVPLRRTIAIGALALSAVSTLIVIGMGIVFVSAPRPPLYQTADELAALDWLGAQTTDRDVVLSDWRFGNLLPIYANTRVFVGHPIETIGYTEKRADADHFFDPSTPEADRQALIDRWQITFVVAPTDRPTPPHGQIVFQQGPLSIYQIAPR